ncbi:hypothetical protein BGZ65_000209 [Modicella reniformis]|uniref:Uncharacterized protein n=1 Tax=Modicella reniformis TaxID=1440133 RepID=A0A9P6SUF3_9FUNG|nr:hypothetical protein BGZ65_000209 [Modicella reniformis]
MAHFYLHNSLCDGPCATVFEYLVENIKPRSGTRRAELQAKEFQCRELALVIAQRQREITEVKERIKHQRQLESIKAIHHKQSVHKAQVLQEYQSLFQQLRLRPVEVDMAHHEHNSTRYTLETTLARTLEEVARVTKAVAIDGTLLRPDQTADVGGVQDLHQHIQQSQDGGIYLLDIIKDLKEKSLSSLELSRREHGRKQEDRSANSEAAELLQLFREHHIERVVEIESVLNRMAVCEREKEELYSRMRFQAQKREQEKGASPYLQVLEESKAHRQGLGTALEFIQSEQENLVERVISIDEQQSTLESLGKASRSVDQKMVHLQRIVRKLIEMNRINQQGVSLTTDYISDVISRSFSEGLSHLSDLAQDQKYTMESDAVILKDLTERSQQTYAKAHSMVLQPPVLCQQESSMTKVQESGSRIWREVMTASRLSADQYILQLSGLQRQVAIRSLGVKRTKLWNEQMAHTKSEATSTMKAFIKTLPQESQIHEDKDGDGHMGVDSLLSKFEYDIKGVARSITKFQDDHFTSLQRDMEQSLGHAEAGDKLVQGIHSLKKDSAFISEHLRTSNRSFKPVSKRLEDKHHSSLSSIKLL